MFVASKFHQNFEKKLLLRSSEYQQELVSSNPDDAAGICNRFPWEQNWLCCLGLRTGIMTLTPANPNNTSQSETCV